MIFLIRKAYAYGNYFKEKLNMIKTAVWYRCLFGHIGNKSIVFKPLRLINAHNVYIGDGVRIYKDSRIETVERWGEIRYSPRITIGNNTSVEQRLHLICASRVDIGENVVISADVMITDNNHKYSEINRNVIQQDLEVIETRIGNYCFIGMGAKIMAGARLGDNCIVGANSVVTGEFQGYTVLAGSPARIIKRYDFEKGIWRRTNERGEFIDEI